ncbi:hypothetical protein MAIT1_00816 [Magnetofaba australis IT-1]|uniref:Uncharacterized protein n=1 Tax=Magnetofaba australis IT-1 TaxID=1434232 RepID=A0A1Y2K0P4_9PROT|nr:hypothetical protein MAIT1_00816 [Magnetofaba australis IT-1]
MADVRKVVSGRSTRGRGKLGGRAVLPTGGGSIPAWAGETGPFEVAGDAPAVDPRVGGGNCSMFGEREQIKGRSPRGRGKRSPRAPRRSRPGSIPAWAGETLVTLLKKLQGEVDPRVGGGNSTALAVVPDDDGRSPRGRGKHNLGGAGGLAQRSIPAWAGETAQDRLDRGDVGVDPRVGGGNYVSLGGAVRCLGRSPRGRGKLIDYLRRGDLSRSIPAWAGETGRTRRAAHWRRVDPRVGGGNSRTLAASRLEIGRSPRGRGKPFGVGQLLNQTGSIPAWAGETQRPQRRIKAVEVDPRVGGGNVKAHSQQYGYRGRSPRGRGKLRLSATYALGRRSIPAWAGETPVSRSPHVFQRVDPRVGGGNCRWQVGFLIRRGRSPRGRGKRLPAILAGEIQRSIPAWAGETTRPAPPCLAARVDPRVGGGNLTGCSRWMRAPGRSPRGRGKRRGSPSVQATGRSIPAWAGETRWGDASRSRRAVDPRVGGGNDAKKRQEWQREGRSPRGRGKPSPEPGQFDAARSIPAWAGETTASRCSAPTRGVDPRVGGGNPIRRWGRRGF